MLMCYRNICLQSDWKSSVFTGPPSLLPQGISCFVVVRSFSSPLTRCCNAFEITRAETHFSMSASHKRLTRGCVTPGRRELWLIMLDWSQTERFIKVSIYRKKSYALLLDLVCRKNACVLLCYEISQQLDSCVNITVCISCMLCFYSVHCIWDELSCLALMARNVFIQNAKKKLNYKFHWATDANGVERMPDLTESPELWLSVTLWCPYQHPAVNAGFLKWCMKKENVVN